MTLSNISEPSIPLLSTHMGWGLSGRWKLLLYKGSEYTCSNKALLEIIKSTEQSSTTTHQPHKHNIISSRSNSTHIIEH